MKFSLKPLLSIMAGAVLLTGCAATDYGDGIYEGATVDALVNIHADSARGKMYALNYQFRTVIPMCSKVTITDIGTKEIWLTHNGKRYVYLWDKHTRRAGVSLVDNFKSFFGTGCDTSAVARLSDVDKKGIKQGRALRGMSKAGVEFAMGRPPIHATPSLAADQWMYWLNKFNRQEIIFGENGLVKKVRN